MQDCKYTIPAQAAEQLLFQILSFTLRVLASEAPAGVTLNGDSVAWRYDGNDLAVVVELPELKSDKHHRVTLSFASSAAPLADGTIGRMRRTADAIEYIKYHGFDTHGDELAAMGTVAEAIEASPATARKAVDRFNAAWHDLPGVVARQHMPDSVATEFLRRAGRETSH